MRLRKALLAWRHLWRQTAHGRLDWRLRATWQLWNMHGRGRNFHISGPETGEELLTDADRQRAAEVYEAERLAQGTDFRSLVAGESDTGPKVDE